MIEVTTVLLFHHALGLTAGVRDFAERLRAAGHAVETPDLFGGAVFDSIDAGVAHAEGIGFEELASLGARFADGLGDGLVVAGFSLGVLPAQKLAQTRPGVVGALLYHAAVPTEVFGCEWPDGVALQMHLTADDELASEDLEAARTLAAVGAGELFVYPGSGHLVAEVGFVDHDPDQAALILERTLAFLDACVVG